MTAPSDSSPVTPLPRKLGITPGARVARAMLERRLDALVAALEPRGGLWIAWPKRSSGVASDLDDRTVRELGLGTGLVDNKVCAIDETWSGLRFVRRRRVH
jgi:hypothetical protein